MGAWGNELWWKREAGSRKLKAESAWPAWLADSSRRPPPAEGVSVYPLDPVSCIPAPYTFAHASRHTRLVLATRISGVSPGSGLTSKVKTGIVVGSFLSK